MFQTRIKDASGLFRLLEFDFLHQIDLNCIEKCSSFLPWDGPHAVGCSGLLWAALGCNGGLVQFLGCFRFLLDSYGFLWAALGCFALLWVAGLGSKMRLQSRPANTSVQAQLLYKK
jgi:hypothetical protein